MDKSVPTKVIVKTAYHSAGYSPTFRYCPNCKKSIGGSWTQTECRHCGQKILWK